MTVASALWGTILGAMLAGIPGDRYGRRDSLRAMAVLYLISALGCAFAWNWSAVVCFRFIGGLGIGGSSVLGPMYIAEVAPAKWRGRLVGLCLREPRLAHYGSRRAHVTCYTASLHLVDFKCASSFGDFFFRSLSNQPPSTLRHRPLAP